MAARFAMMRMLHASRRGGSAMPRACTQVKDLERMLLLLSLT